MIAKDPSCLFLDLYFDFVANIVLLVVEVIFLTIDAVVPVRIALAIFAMTIGAAASFIIIIHRSFKVKYLRCFDFQVE